MSLAQVHRRTRAWVAVVVAVVVVALVAVFVWPGLGSAGSTGTAAGPGATTGGSSTTTQSEGSEAEPPVPTAEPRIVPMVASDTAPTANGVSQKMTARLAKTLTYTITRGEHAGEQADEPMADAVENLAGIVIDPKTGKTLWAQQATAPRLPASTMKLLTGAALLTWADPSDRLVTTVVQGAQPGQIVFVGGGDVTLSARPQGTPTVLPGGPTVQDLAEQIKASGVEVTSIVLDTSYWSGETFAVGWEQSDIAGTQQDRHGFVTHMSPLMVDGDRVDPSLENSPRTGTPAMTAGQALARALGQEDLPITMGVAPDGAKVLAKVKSQPLSTLLSQALLRSDNILTEALAREAAIALGAPPSFDGVKLTIKKTLQKFGIDTTGMVVEDGSGMSTNDRVPTDVLAQVMAIAVSGSQPNMRLLLGGLPLAGVTGTLAENSRYTQSLTDAGRGWVRAKTGSLTGANGTTYYGLVGYVPSVDGRLLVFAFNSKGVSGNVNRYAQDALATALRTCGCSG